MSGCCATLATEFDHDYVARERIAREKRGRGGHTSARLVELVASPDVSGVEIEGASLLDIGAGFGDIQAALFDRGLASATHVEASGAYSAAARELAREEPWGDRVLFEVGDFVQRSDELPEVDVVTLDRVVCCYPDMPVLLDRSAPHARRLYALSAPRDGRFIRAVIGLRNLVRRVRGDPFRTFVHSWSAMDERLRGLGLIPCGESGTIVWRIAIYRRTDPPAVRGRTTRDTKK